MEENRTTQDKEESLNSDNEFVDDGILKWDSHRHYFMASVCWAAGLGNSWRFAVSFNVNNGAFIFPYVLQTIFIIIPLVYMEIGLGQFCGRGPIGIWQMCPIWKGVGFGSILLLIGLMAYYNIICSYFLHYLLASLSSVLPWSICNPDWADINCMTYEQNASIRLDCTRIFKAYFCDNLNWEPSSTHYWKRKVLNLSGEFGTISLELLACSAFTIFLVFLFNCKGTRSLKKVLWFLTIFPYIEICVLLFVLLINPGGSEGVKSFVSPQLKKVVDISLWRSAFEQSCLSMGIGMGGLFMLGSQCNFRNAAHVNAISLTVIDMTTSIIYALVIYSLLGCLSRGLNMPIEEIHKWPDSLMFGKVPSALLFLPPIQQIWAVLFYSSIYLMGLRSETIMMTTVLSTVYEAFPETTSFSILWSAIGSFLVLMLGYPYLSQMGAEIVFYSDNVIVGPTITLVCLLEGIGIVCFYGITHFVDDIHFMLGFRPNAFWFVCWMMLPITLGGSFMLSFQNFANNKSMKPPWLWLRILQWIIISLPIIILIVVMILCYLKSYKKKTFLKLFRPSSTWGPKDLILKKSRGMFTAHSMTKEYLYRQERLKVKEDDDTDDEIFYM